MTTMSISLKRLIFIKLVYLQGDKMWRNQQCTPSVRVSQGCINSQPASSYCSYTWWNKEPQISGVKTCHCLYGRFVCLSNQTHGHSEYWYCHIINSVFIAIVGSDFFSDRQVKYCVGAVKNRPCIILIFIV
jgi:hypothetical protein